MTSEDEVNSMELTVGIVSAFVSNNSVSITELPGLIASVSAALKGNNVQQQTAPEPQQPAVPVKKSIRPDSLTCLECGKTFKSLKRHIRTDHDLEPDQYRAKWDLKRDYPMVAPNYAEARSALARQIGLGRKAQPETAAAPQTAPAAKPAKAKRQPKAKAA